MFLSLCAALFSFSEPVVPADTGYVVVQSIRFAGNVKTKERILSRELDFRAGDTLRQADLAERLELNRRKVFNTNLFVTVEATARPVGPQAVDVEFNLKEQWYILAFPVFTLADRNFNEWWYERGRDLRRTIYGVNLRHLNFRGRAEELKLNLEFGFANYYEFFYRLPYLDRAQKIGATFGVSYQNTKNLPYRTDADKLVYLLSEDLLRERFYANVIFRRRSKFYDFQYLELRYAQNRVADTVGRYLNPNYFGEGRTRQQFWVLAYTYTYDFRDKGQYPLRGHFFSAGATKWGLLPGDDLQQLDLTAGYSRYLPLSKRWFVAATLKGRLSLPGNQPFLQTRGLGYQNDLVRGYELYTIDGQSFGLLRTTLKVQALDRTFFLNPLRRLRQFNTLPLAIYPNVFFDAGYVRNAYPERNASTLANRYLFGTGAGLDFVTWYNTVFRIHYAVNDLGEAGIRFNLSREF
jgi:outer membrane protein assembly factor BamA